MKKKKIINKVRRAGNPLHVIVNAVDSVEKTAARLMKPKKRKPMKMLKEYYWYKLKGSEDIIKYAGYSIEESKFVFIENDKFVLFNNLNKIDLDSGKVISLDMDAADFFAVRLVALIGYKKTVHGNTEEMEEALETIIKDFKKYADFDEEVNIEDTYYELMDHYRRLWT